MLFGFGNKKGKKNRSVISVTLLASAAFIVLAIFGWDLPIEKAANYLLITVVLLLVLIGSAFVAVFLWNKLKGLFH